MEVGAQHGEVSQRAHRERHMPVPAVPPPHLVLVEPYPPFRPCAVRGVGGGGVRSGGVAGAARGAWRGPPCLARNPPPPTPTLFPRPPLSRRRTSYWSSPPSPLASARCGGGTAGTGI